MAEYTGESSTHTEKTSRKRSSRACDACRARRSKCEDVKDLPGQGLSCKSCREVNQECMFTLPVRKRGPPRGFKSRSTAEAPEDPINNERSTSDQASRTTSPSPNIGTRVRSLARSSEPFFGIPTPMVDQLLAVYFTHVHNVWPLICKPVFNPHHIPAHLLLSMLAVASCVAPEAEVDGLDATTLFVMAERALLQKRMENRVDMVQSFILMSLRQTGCGDKKSAAMYANRASIMVLTLGLNLDPGTNVTKSTSPALAYEQDTRARVYWNCYVLDKVIAEETGRPFILPCRRSSVPFPSINEIDELEAWPPLPLSSVPLPPSVRHVIPRRGYIMSCFVWTCRLAMIVEDIMDLETEGPNVVDTGVWWDGQFAAEAKERRGGGQHRERIKNQLNLWKQALPAHLDVDCNAEGSPLPHHVVGITWYHTARILLFSRFLKRHPAHESPVVNGVDTSVESHTICSESAQAVVDLMSLLDRNRLLKHISSDVIHLLSLTTLFEAYDSVSNDRALANRAKLNFSQCCLWLREFSSSWAAASAHRVFFEGLIRGGLQLSSPEELEATAADKIPSAPGDTSSPSVSEGLRAIHRQLTTTDPSSKSNPGTSSSSRAQPALPHPSPSRHVDNLAPANLFQLPQYYWNQLANEPEAGTTAVTGLQMGTPAFSPFGLSSFGNSPEQAMGMGLMPPGPGGQVGQQGVMDHGMVSWDQMGQGGSGNGQVQVGQGMGQSSGARAGQGPGGEQDMVQGVNAGDDQSAIYSALMSYMMDAIKGG
ncbi:hypothetical protein IAT38_003855 [Cryptococcus sp. DSM 104549]